MTTTATTPLGSTVFGALGTTVRLLTTEPLVLAEAEAIVRDHLVALDLAASRFRDDSEVSMSIARRR